MRPEVWVSWAIQTWRPRRRGLKRAFVRLGVLNQPLSQRLARPTHLSVFSHALCITGSDMCGQRSSVEVPWLWYLLKAACVAFAGDGLILVALRVRHRAASGGLSPGLEPQLGSFALSLQKEELTAWV